MIDRTMRAVVLDEPGQPMALEEIPTPSPQRGEVLVRVGACGVCHTDLHVIKGEVAFPTPAVLGHEISGTVAALGPGVESVRVGEPVAAAFIMPCGSCTSCAVGRDDLCERFFALNRLRGVYYDGTSRLQRTNGETLAMYSMAGLADYCVIPANDVFPLPDGLALHETAIAGCAIFTAYGAVRHAADLRPGATVAVVATGGIGSNIIQVAAAFGARRIIAVDIGAARLDAARRLGATDTVDVDDGDVVARVRELTDGAGVDVAFEALGRPETFANALGSVCDGGTLVAVGIGAGDAAASVGITHLVRRSIRIVGSYGARSRSDMPAVLRLLADGRLSTSSVTRRVGLDDADRIYQRLAAGEVVGRALVVP